MVAGVVGATGITTPSVIASQKGGEVTVLAEEVSEIKIELDEKEKTLLTITTDHNQVKQLLEEKEKKINTLQTMLSRIIDTSKKAHSESNRIIEKLDRDNKALMYVLNKHKNIKGWLRFVADKCGHGRCEDHPKKEQKKETQAE